MGSVSDAQHDSVVRDSFFGHACQEWGNGTGSVLGNRGVL